MKGFVKNGLKALQNCCLSFSKEAPSKPLQIETFACSDFYTNQYLVYQEDCNDVVIIDTPMKSFDTTGKMEVLKDKKLKIFLTHGHYDHVSDVEMYLSQFGENNVDIFYHKNDKELVKRSLENLHGTSLAGSSVTFVGDGDRVEIFDDKFVEILHLPGHTSGGIGVFFPHFETLFSGDTLFYQSIGRTDFDESDFEDIVNSIQQKIYTLDDKVRCFPGHGPYTDVGHEKKNNGFVNEKTVQYY